MKKIIILLVALFGMSYSVNVNAADISELATKLASGEKTIVLEEDYEGDPTGIFNDVTIDLNGHKINAVIGVLADVTLKDSKGTGEITSDLDGGATVQILESGKLTLDGAIITNTAGYGIAAYDGTKVIVNSGKVVSVYSAISGNNTEGDLTVVINGGELTAKKGPAIYMPSPVGCTVTGGVINGGLSVRMGVINISGGKFIANSVLDSIETSYKLSANIGTGDALYVLGGTYNTDSKEGNKLVLNVTGGEFINENGSGSAIAIYDLGKVEQNISVNISGDIKAITNSKTRTGFDVLSLSEAGITNPDSGYGKYSGKVTATITGGTFSGDVSKYVADGYDANFSNGVSKVAKNEVKVVVPAKDATIGVSGNYTEALKDALENSKLDVKKENATVEVSVKALDEKEVSEDVIAKIADYVKMSSKKLTVASYFDISLLVKNANNEEIGTLSEVAAPIEFKMVLTDELKDVKTGYIRNYFILRIHDDKTEIIPAKVDNETLVFSSDKFSNYVLAYEDTPEVKNPATLDNSVSYIYTGALSLITLMGAGYLIKKRCK